MAESRRCSHQIQSVFDRELGCGLPCDDGMAPDDTTGDTSVGDRDNPVAQKWVSKTGIESDSGPDGFVLTEVGGGVTTAKMNRATEP